MKKLLLLLSLFCGSALAGYTDWQEISTGLKGTTGATTTLYVDKYSGLYPLKSVDFQLSANSYALYNFVDASGYDNTFLFTADVTVTVPDLAFVLTVITDIERTVGPFESYSSPYYSLNPSTTDFLSSLLNGTSSKLLTYTDPALLDMFEGDGDLSLMTSANIVNKTVSNGDNDTSVRSRYDATLKVRYYYDVPVPEPDTLMLTVVGLIGLIGLNHRALVQR